MISIDENSLLAAPYNIGSVHTLYQHAESHAWLTPANFNPRLTYRRCFDRAEAFSDSVALCQ